MPIDPYEYRNACHLQLEEHSIISLRYPLCLNSAPGGFLHDYRLDILAPQPRTVLPRDPVPDSLVDAVRRHVTGLCQLLARQPKSPGNMNAEALAQYIRAATPQYCFEGRIPMACISKDMTHEEYEGRHAELGYRERLAGPGPQATNAGLLYQLGEDPWTVSTERRLYLLPPMIDRFVVVTLH